MKQISKDSGIAAWNTAEKHGKKFYPAFFRYNNRIIAHEGDVYTEGQYGDFGFCTQAAKNAEEKGGVWLD